MSFMLSPPTSPRQDTSGDDGLDNLLRSFYKAQLPDPWPSCEAPPDRRVLFPLSPAARRRQPLLRSRLALAASVVLLVAGGEWLLHGAFQPAAVTPPALTEAPGPQPSHPSADNRDRLPPAPVAEPETRMPPMEDEPFSPNNWPR
jgi:hypothetical protein